MTGCARGCMGSVGTGLLLLVVAWAGWRWGGELFPRIESFVGNESVAQQSSVEPSAAIAEEALGRFNAFRLGDTDSTFALTDLELTSIVRYALPGVIPNGVSRPAVEVRDDRLILSARVAISAFPDLPALNEVKGLLPDTVRIEMTASLLPFDAGHAALVVDGVEASNIPLPGRVIPGILETLGRQPLPGLPSTALAVPLPNGIRQAWASEGSLVFRAEQ